MRWMRCVPQMMCVVCFATTALLWSCSPATKQDSAAPAAMTPEQRLAHGKYLVAVLGCGDCHTPGGFYGTPDTTRLLAGSELGWKGPWGTSYARNLTPDSTGIGAWTEAQIVTAIREGRRPDGSPLMPPMPWTDFAHLTDEDAQAVAAYLKTLPAVKHVNLSLVPPSKKPAGAYLEVPPPPAWDAAPKQAAAK